MKWKIPLVLQQVGNIRCPRPRIILRVMSRYGLSHIPFFFDTGADLTTVPIPLARREGIAFSEGESARGTAVGLVGSTIRYRSTIRVLIGREGFEWPCDFLVPPASA